MSQRASQYYLLLLSAFTLAVTITFFPVVRADLQNPVAFPVATAPLLLVFAGLAVALTLLISAIGIWTPAWRRICVLFNVALALIAWLKGTVLGWDYGSLVGDAPDWQTFRLQGALDIALCVAIFLGVVIARRWVLWKAATICRFVCVAQALHLVWLSPVFSERTFADMLGKETLEVAEKRDEIVSTTNNLVVIILDTFQSDAFADLLARQPTLADALPGFRFFADTASAYPFTFFSVPAVLTGENYLNQIPYPKYQFDSYAGPNSIMKNLMDGGYYVELDRWGLSTPIPYRSMLASNLLQKFFPTTETTTIMQLVALYTIAPQFLKQQMFDMVSRAALDAIGPLDTNVAFIRNILRLPTRLTEQPVAKIIHLRGPHLPHRRYEKSGFDYFAAARDGETQFSELKQSLESYAAVAEQSIRGVVGYLKRLQDAGVYDKSTVFVFGDHGAGLQGLRFNPPPAWNIGTDQHIVNSALRTTALPLLIAKQAGASGPMQTTHAPVSLLDINCTIRKLLPTHADDACFSLFDPAATPPVSRPFYSIEMRFDPQGYLPAIKAFEIKGPAWNNDSWRALPIQYLPHGRIYQIPPYKIEEMISFVRGGNAYDYQSFGWGEAGEGFTWTIGKRADLTIPLSKASSEPLTLEASITPFVVPGKLDSQTIDVVANGEKLATWIASDPGSFRTAIPGRIAASGRLDLRFDLPNATSPAALGLGKDVNEFGIQVNAAAIRNRSYKIGDTIRFGRSGNANDYQSGEWGAPSDGFTWTGDDASLALALLDPVDAPLMLEMQLTPLAVPGKVEGQIINVHANGEKIAEWHANASGRYRAAIPARIAGSGHIDLRLNLPNARSLAELGLGEDKSELGAQVSSVRLYPATVHVGDTLTFGVQGSAERYQTSGWNQPSPGFTWTYGERANLTLPLKDGKAGPLTLYASFVPLVVPGKVESQTIDVFANGENIAQWKATGAGRFKAIIPARLTAKGVVELGFVLPDATSPFRLGTGTDPTLYGLQMQSINLDNNPYAIGDALIFGEHGNSKRYQSDGWGDPQTGFTWTIGHRSTLDLDLTTIPSTPLTIEASLIPFVVPERLERQAVIVSVNGERLAEWSVGQTGKFEAQIPARLLQSGHVELRFDLPNATSPAALGLNNDALAFAVQVLQVTLR